MDFASTFNLPFEKKTDNPKKFLIVDDDSRVKKIIKRIVKKSYPESIVYEAADGFAAGALLGSSNIDLMFLDIDLPGIDGFDVMKNIEKTPDLYKPGILVITGLLEKGIEKKVKNSIADKLILKPFDTDRLRDAVRGIVEK